MGDCWRIELIRSGGFAGLVGARVTVSRDELPDEEAAVYEDLFSRVEAERAAAPRPAVRHGADRFQYDVVISRGQLRTHLTLTEGAMPPATEALVKRVLGRQRPR